jgi:hypothetical protein
LPQQDAELWFRCALVCPQPGSGLANLEHDSEYFMRSASMDHVFDSKSKTSGVRKERP